MTIIQQTATGKIRVKKTRQEFLLLLLSGIEEGLMLTQLAERVGKSKQALNYHIRNLRRFGVIERIQSYPYSIYRLTPFGVRVKEIIRYPDGLKSKPTYRCHGLQVGYTIEDFGSFRFVETKHRNLSHMTGWDYVAEQVGDYHVKIQENGLMIVSCPDCYTAEPVEAFVEMRRKADAVANLYAFRYGMKFKTDEVKGLLRKTVRRGQQSLVGSHILAKLFGKGKITDKMWVDASGGTDELEEFEGGMDIQELIKLPNRVTQLEETMASKLVPTLEALTEQIRLHLSATGTWKDSAVAISTGVAELIKAVNELKEAVKNREKD